LWNSSDLLDKLFGIDEAYERSVEGWAALIHPDNRVMMVDYFGNEVLGQGQAFDKEYRILRHADRTERWVHGLGKLEFDRKGHPLKMHGTIQDITERKQAEEALQQLNAQLERRVEERTSALSRANAELARTAHAKDEFLASMSHELRTPLNAILTLAESLEEGIYEPLSDRQRQPLHTISESGYHLLSLINDILDVSKIEAGKLELQLEPAEVEAVCQASLRLIKQLALQKQLEVSLNLDRGVTMIRADARRLKQMLVNLLSNAVKFTPAGGRIGLDVQGNAEGGVAQFTVWDTGIGIAPEDTEHLFEPFVQIDSGLNRQYSGTGLGLSLVYRLAQMHGGSIGLVSAPNQGSRFTLSLPWAPPKEPHDTRPLPPLNLPNVQRALIIEDMPSAAEHLARYLSELGAQVTVCPLGKSAFEQALAVRPEIILLDIQLPDLSGWEVLEKLKSDQRTQAIPVILVTVVDEPAHGLALGAADYIVKPLTRPRLHEALRNVFAKTLASTATYFPVVLIAEDNLANQTVYADYLIAKGYRVSVAANGLEALDRARETRPDLILMDIQMPRLDGLEAIRRIRADPNLQAIPIIALTALAMPGDRERCLAAGANDYLTKPVSLILLARTLATHLREQPK
jgi:PAS domain S-box-containing protein